MTSSRTTLSADPSPDGDRMMAMDQPTVAGPSRVFAALGRRVGLERAVRRLANRYERTGASAGIPRFARVPAPALVVYAYHRVGRAPDPYLPALPESVFRTQMERLSRSFRVLPLAEAVDRLENGGLPDDAVCLTFDDGYRDNHDVALPILREFGLPATVFLVTGSIDTGEPPWYDRVFRAFALTSRKALTEEAAGGCAVSWSCDRTRAAAREEVLSRLKSLAEEERDATVARIEAESDVGPPPGTDRIMLHWDEVRAMRRDGIDFGAHTVRHPILTRVDDARARREIVESRDRITAVLGEPPRAFAYPNGQRADFDERVRRKVREAGFALAVSTILGVNPSADGERRPDRYAIRRCWAHDADPDLFALRTSWYRLTLARRADGGHA